MKSLTVSLLVVCLVGLAYCADDAAQANAFVDQFITALKAKKNFDPMEIGEHESEVTERIGFLNVKAKVSLHKTTLTGLGHALRVGNAALENKDGSFSAKLQLGDSNVKAQSDVTIHVGHVIHPNLKIDADIGHLTVTFAITLGSDGKATLKEFHIDEMKDLKVHTHGQIALLDPALDILIGQVNQMFNSIVRDVLTQVIKPVLQDEMTKLMGPSN